MHFLIPILLGLSIGFLINHNQNKNTKLIMSKISSLATTLNTLADQAESIKKSLDEYKAALGDADLSAEAQAALDRLTGDVNAIGQDIPPQAAPPEAAITSSGNASAPQ